MTLSKIRKELFGISDVPEVSVRRARELRTEIEMLEVCAFAHRGVDQFDWTEAEELKEHLSDIIDA
jgi:predicted Ser/Thr protein kinase